MNKLVKIAIVSIKIHNFRKLIFYTNHNLTLSANEINFYTNFSSHNWIIHSIHKKIAPTAVFHR